jgi:hypothetical protein
LDFVTLSSQLPPAPSDETAHRPAIVVLNRDMFFGVKIGNTLRGLGYEVEFAKDAARFVESIAARGPRAVLGLIDIAAGVEWESIRAFRADGTVPVLAFGSHLDVDGFRAAKSAGVTRVVSNGDFHRDMVALVKRYARSVDVAEDAS